MGLANFFKTFIPAPLLRAARPWYHGALSYAAHWYFGRPSRELIIIGVTGTNGKTTTSYLAAKLLSAAGIKCGLISTAIINLGAGEQFNDYKMTMPAGVSLEKSLKAMKQNGCRAAVVEVSSEGLAQNRHWGIEFDVAVFTNLTPEHIEAHGSFARYRAAKDKLFALVARAPLSGRKRQMFPGLQRTIVYNADDEHGAWYARHGAEQKLSLAIQSPANLQARAVVYAPTGVSFMVGQTQFALALKGRFDVYNALSASAVGQVLGVPLSRAAAILSKILVVPGRMEVLAVSPFMAVVDYCYDAVALEQLYATVAAWKPKSIIQVLGPTGGGRDKWRIPIMGKLAAATCRLVIITTDDPYDDSPAELAELMAQGAAQSGKKMGQDIIIELNRQWAIRAAFQAAAPGDVVLITGKGADQKMCLANGVMVDWDDRFVARQELLRLSPQLGS